MVTQVVSLGPAGNVAAISVETVESLVKKNWNYCRYLASNERLVQRIAESYPVRRAAQLAVSVFYRSKAKLADADPHRLDRLVAFYKRFAQNVKEGIEDAKKQVKK